MEFLSPSRRRFSARNVLSGVARGETAVFASYIRREKWFFPLDWPAGWIFPWTQGHISDMPHNNKTTNIWIWRNFAKGLSKRKIRRQKGPLESGNLDEMVNWKKRSSPFFSSIVIYSPNPWQISARFAIFVEFATLQGVRHWSILANPWANFTIFFHFHQGSI